MPRFGVDAVETAPPRLSPEHVPAQPVTSDAVARFVPDRSRVHNVSECGPDSDIFCPLDALGCDAADRAPGVGHELPPRAWAAVVEAIAAQHPLDAASIG